MNYDTGSPKKAYYVEGTPHETGWLMGNMAEPEIARMMDFTDRVVFLHRQQNARKNEAGPKYLVGIIHELSKDTAAAAAGNNGRGTGHI